jgi:hypothetical protein
MDRLEVPIGDWPPMLSGTPGAERVNPEGANDWQDHDELHDHEWVVWGVVDRQAPAR